MAQTKEEKARDKAIASAEKIELGNLSEIQALEIKALTKSMKGSGLSSAEIKEKINAEKAANKLEYTNAKGLLNTAGLQSTIPKGGKYVTTSQATYKSDSGYGKEVSDRLKNVSDTAYNYNMNLNDTAQQTDAYRARNGYKLSSVDSLLQRKEDKGTWYDPIPHTRVKTKYTAEKGGQPEKSTSSAIMVNLGNIGTNILKRNRQMGEIFEKRESWNGKTDNLTAEDIANRKEFVSGYSPATSYSEIKGIKQDPKTGLFTVPSAGFGYVQKYFSQNADGTYSEAIRKLPKGAKEVKGFEGVYSYTQSTSTGGYVGMGGQNTGYVGMGGQNSEGSTSKTTKYIKQNADGTFQPVIQTFALTPNLDTIKKVKGYDNVYRVVSSTSVTSDDTSTHTEYFTKNADGLYKPFMMDYSYFEKRDQDDGFGSLGGMLVGAAVTLATGGAGLGLSAIASGALGGAASGLVSGGGLDGALKGAVAGGVGGAISSGALSSTSSLSPSSIAGNASSAFGLGEVATAAVEKGINGAITGGLNVALNGGDFSSVLAGSVISGTSTGAGAFAGGTVANNMSNGIVSSTIAGSAGGAAAEGTNALLNNGNVGNAVIQGAAAGGVSGAVTNITGSSAAGSAIGSVAGGAVGNAINAGSNSQGTNTTTTNSTTNSGTKTTTTTPTVFDTGLPNMNVAYKNLNQPRDFSIQKWSTG